MAKKALVSTVEPYGQDNTGYRVVQVVEVGQEFEVHSSLVWKDCSDDIVPNMWWYKPDTETFKKMPYAVDPVEALGALAEDADGNPTERFVWNWDTESWSKETV
jgi:hypothetical protein